MVCRIHLLKQIVSNLYLLLDFIIIMGFLLFEAADISEDEPFKVEVAECSDKPKGSGLIFCTTNI